MVISEAERAKRQRFIGASDAGAILGLSPYKTAVDVWYSKMYETKETSIPKAAMRGILLEDGVIKWAEMNLKAKIEQDVRYERHYLDRTPIAANCDGIVIDSDPLELVEAKTAKYAGDWGKAGTDEIPDYYLVQTVVQMWASGAVRCWVPVLTGELDFKMYCVERNEALEGRVLKGLDEFWQSYVAEGVRPEGPPPPTRLLAAVARDPETVVELTAEDEQLILQWEEAKAVLNAEKKRVESMKGQVIELLVGCEVGQGPTGHLVYAADRGGRKVPRWKSDGPIDTGGTA